MYIYFTIARNCIYLDKWPWHRHIGQYVTVSQLALSQMQNLRDTREEIGKSKM